MNSLVIGLTGGIGTGKSTAANMLKQHGADVIDVDQIGRNVLYEDNDARAKVIDHFGPSIIDTGGGINRSTLAKIVGLQLHPDKTKILYASRIPPRPFRGLEAEKLRG